MNIKGYAEFHCRSITLRRKAREHAHELLAHFTPWWEVELVWVGDHSIKPEGVLLIQRSFYSSVQMTDIIQMDGVTVDSHQPLICFCQFYSQ